MRTAVEDGARVLVPLRVAGVPAPPAGRVHALGGETMGTTWQVRLVGAAGAPLASWRAIVQRELDLVVCQMSTWLADSDLSRFNAAPAGSSHSFPPELEEVLCCATQVAQASGGAFDATAGALVDLWGFGPGQRYDAQGFVPPSSDDVARTLSRCGWRRVARDAEGLHVQPGGTRLDFSAIAKGYAVDRVSEALRAVGAADCLVEIGGELRGRGIKTDGQPWWVELDSPAPQACPMRVALHDLSVATSGDYRRFFVDAAGRRRAHTIDPRSGEPVTHGVAAVSVLHEECMRADAWSTALTVLGPEEGLALATRHGLAALFVQRRTGGGFAETATPALRDMLV